MTSISLPDDLEAWARAEVAAGRAESVEALVQAVLRERRDSGDLKALLDEAREEIAQGKGAPLEQFSRNMKRRIVDLRARAKAEWGGSQLRSRLRLNET